jgi:phosphatidate cytidylyltransferase
MPAARRPAADPEPRRRGTGRRDPRSDLWARIVVAVPAAIVVVVFIDVGGLAFSLFMVAVAWVCLYELYRLLARWRPAPAVGFVAVAAMALSARSGGQFDLVLAAVLAVPALFLFVAFQGRGNTTVSMAGTLLGVYWIGLAASHAVLLRALSHGDGVLIDVLIGTFLGDTGAYVGGRLFGRRPLAPRISPNKTVEGLLVGMLVAVVSVLVAGLFQQTWMTQGHALLLGIVVAVVGPLGDLFESMVKRDAGSKDAGTLFGPHGGALDRADAALFTIVAGYYIWYAVIS